MRAGWITVVGFGLLTVLFAAFLLRTKKYMIAAMIINAATIHTHKSGVFFFVWTCISAIVEIFNFQIH